MADADDGGAAAGRRRDAASRPTRVHPLPEIDWDLQIPKRGDQRQMENWQRLGTYAAGLALDDARMKGDDALCATMDMVVAAAGGERDDAVDAAILAASTARTDLGVLAQREAHHRARPTLFLAQLSNLLAGNISIVHKVTGSSRTFMGEEGAGVSAVEIAAARIRAGQSTHALVGGAMIAEHPGHASQLRARPVPARGRLASVWARAGRRAAASSPARARPSSSWNRASMPRSAARRPMPRLGRIASGNARRDAGVAAAIARLFATADPARREPALALSGASGAAQGDHGPSATALEAPAAAPFAASRR